MRAWLVAAMVVAAIGCNDGNAGAGGQDAGAPGTPRLTLVQGAGVRGSLDGNGHHLQVVVGQPLGAPLQSASHRLEPGLMPQSRVP